MDEIATILALFLFTVALTAIGGVGVMISWNHIFPDIFGWKEISFTQGWSLLLLCIMLFKPITFGKD